MLELILGPVVREQLHCLKSISPYSDIYSVPAKEIEEELDYDENMDDIELHVYRPEDLDVHDKDREEKITEPSITSGVCIMKLTEFVLPLC